jgi:hypothetical protein
VETIQIDGNIYLANTIRNIVFEIFRNLSYIYNKYIGMFIADDTINAIEQDIYSIIVTTTQRYGIGTLPNNVVVVRDSIDQHNLTITEPKWLCDEIEKIANDDYIAYWSYK